MTEEEIPLEIIYQDDYLVAINKPSGLLVHRSMIDRHETRFAIQLLRDQIGQRVYPTHRLDKPTSGVLLFALAPENAKHVTRQFENRTTSKHYIAVVRGHTKPEGVIDYPLKEQLDKIADRQAQQDKEAQDAVTAYQTLSTVELPFAVRPYETSRYSLVKLIPKTGRKHQLRRHMKHIFHPIVGDTTHGDGHHNASIREHFNCHRLLLHSRELTITHPVNGDEIHLQADFDDAFKHISKAFNWSDRLYC